MTTITIIQVQLEEQLIHQRKISLGIHVGAVGLETCSILASSFLALSEFYFNQQFTNRNHPKWLKMR